MVSSIAAALNYFPELEGALRVLVAPSLEQLQVLAARADQTRLSYDALGYSLERSRNITPEEQEDPLGATEQAAELANQYDKPLVLGPGLQLMQDHWSDYAAMAALVDVWILQTQHLQVHPPGTEYRQEVEKVVRELRSGNPGVKIWAQISVTPGQTVLSVEEWLAYRDSILDLVDGIYVLDVSDPSRPETLEAIFARICGSDQ